MAGRRIEDLLQQCIVRIDSKGSKGTGFYVAPGLILTCAHVVINAWKTKSRVVTVIRDKESCSAKIVDLKYVEDSGLDIALLECRFEKSEKKAGTPPCVFIDYDPPLLKTDLYSYGFTGGYEGDPVTFVYEGLGEKDNYPVLKLKSGQAQAGLSGAPVLNYNNYKVCGIMIRSRGTKTIKGGRAIPFKTVIRYFPQIKEYNDQYHRENNCWRRLFPGIRIHNKIPDLQSRLLPLYLPLNCSETVHSIEGSFDLLNETEKFLESDIPILTIFGDSGSGKTTFCYYLVKKLEEQFRRDSTAFCPVYIKLGTALKFVNEGTLIETELTKRGLSEAEIITLKQRKNLLFILDGYDELGIKKNIYISNHLDAWDAKVIITCRKQYLKTIKDYLPLFSEEGSAFLPDGKSFKVLYITPFSSKKIDEYLKKFFSIQKKPDDWMYYKNKIDTIYNLRELAANPLLLYIIVSTFPEMNKFLELTKGKLYLDFFNRWFDKEVFRLTKYHGFFEKHYFFEFAQELAFQMFISNNVEIVYEKRQSLFQANEKNPFDIFFDSDTKEVVQAMQGCPIQRTEDNTYRFMHKSFQEFCIAKKICEEINRDNIDNLNRKLLTRDPAIINFIKEMNIKTDTLFSILEESKKDPCLEVAAANAISILNAMKISFANLDLAGVRIAGADLTGAILQKSNLSEANLKNVNLKDSFLDATDFSYANMKDVFFGEMPFFDGHNGDVNTLCLNSENTLLASGGKDDTLCIWDFKERKLLHSHCEKCNWVMAVCFNHKGTILASGHSCNTIKIWNPKNLELLRELSQHLDDVNCLAFNHDSRILVSGSSDCTIRIWETENYRCIKILKAHTHPVFCLAFSPECQWLATGSKDGIVCLWRSVDDDFEHVYTYNTASDGINSLCFSFDGSCLAIGTDNTPFIQLWDIAERKMKSIFEGHTGGVRAVCFDRKGSLLASGSWDNTIRLWDVSTGKLISILEGHNDWVSCLCFTNDDRYLISGAFDNTIRIWDITYLKEVTSEYHNGGVHFLSFSPDASLLVSAGKYDKSVRIWNIKKKQLISIYEDNLIKQIGGVEFTDTGKTLLTIGSSCEAEIDPDGSFGLSSLNPVIFSLWDLHNQREKKIQGLEECCSIWMNGRGTILCGYHSNLWWFWKATDGKLLKKMKDIDTAIFHPTKDAIAYCNHSEKKVIIYDLIENKILHIIEDMGWFQSSFSNDGRFFATGWPFDGKAVIWDLKSGNEYSTLIDRDTKGAFGRLFFSADNRYLVCVNYNNAKIYLWKTDRELPLWVFNEKSEAINEAVVDCRLLPDNSVLYCCHDNYLIRLWNVQTGVLIKEIDMYQKMSFSIEEIERHKSGSGNLSWIHHYRLITCFNKDNTLMACSHQKTRSIHIWDFKKGEIISSLDGHTDKINVLRFFPDNSELLISGSEDHSFKIWNIKSQTLLWSANSQLFCKNVNIENSKGLSGINKQLITQREADLQSYLNKNKPASIQPL